MLKVLGVSAPHYIKKAEGTTTDSLNSNDAFSLYNAFKIAAYKAENKDVDWETSNWSSKEGRDDSILLLQYYNNDLPIFLEKLKKLEPNLLFIGSMTLGFAGAIEIARLAKNILKDKVFIVLGGKHLNETLFEENGNIRQLKSSPLLLMQNKKIPKIFDMVCSGDGEEILYQIGKAVNQSLEKSQNFFNVYKFKGLKEAKGDWILGWMNDRNQCEFLKSSKKNLDYNIMPLTNNLFNISTRFNIFNKSELTAHTMSYLSKGCVHNCFYCSESCNINGKLKQTENAAKRLYKNLESIQEIGKYRYGCKRMSAFVEDSILLAGNPIWLNQLSDLLDKKPLNLEFGGQFTVDTLLNENNQKVIYKLSKQGLTYIFVGLETNDESIMKQMSKNTSKLSWMEKNERVIKFVNNIGIKYGVSVLFGLGESQKERISLMNTIHNWQKTYGLPNIISMNLAVQHPLRKNEDYDYIEWGTDDESEYLKIFVEIFGEASEKYKLPGVILPTIDELKELQYNFKLINNYNLN